MSEFKTLYKLDSKGKVRIWRMELDGSRYRAISGLEDGKQVESGWQYAEGKNIGKSNETTPEQQAVLEIKSHYEKRLKEYHADRDAIFEVKFVKPMTAATWNNEDMTDAKREKVLRTVRGEVCFIQPKLDGIRNLTGKHGMFARSGDPIVSSPHIKEALDEIFHHHNVIFDGELYNHEYKDNFNKISSLINRSKPTKETLSESAEKVQYHVYDMIVPDQPDMTFSDRYDFMVSLLKKYGINTGIVIPVDTWEVDTIGAVDEFHREFRKLGYEGSMIRTNSPYENKRSKFLWKYKDWKDEEYVIKEIIEGTGNWRGAAKSAVFDTHEGKEFKATFKGTYEENVAILADAEKYIGVQATVQFQELTPDGKPRFGRIIKLHEHGKI